MGKLPPKSFVIFSVHCIYIFLNCNIDNGPIYTDDYIFSFINYRHKKIHLVVSWVVVVLVAAVVVVVYEL